MVSIMVGHLICWNFYFDFVDVEGFGSTRYHQTIQPVFSIINAVLSSVVDRGRVMAIRKVILQSSLYGSCHHCVGI